MIISKKKTGAKPGSSWGAFFKLNPDVSDVIDRFGININDKLGLLVDGNSKKGCCRVPFARKMFCSIKL